MAAWRVHIQSNAFSFTFTHRRGDSGIGMISPVWHNPPLPNFSRANWRSTMRKFVTVHLDYADMEPWRGRESTDIVYRDRSGTFTELLVDSGYFGSHGNTLRGKRPKYLIEVKTTTQSANAPFYVSRRQFRMMREHTNAVNSSADSPTIYVIFRVFNVDKDSIGLKIYMDPEKLRCDGLLVFTEQAYAVTPGAGQNAHEELVRGNDTG
ncbi:hypothetical protein F4824DRAFT_474516 [Ustulina deusta]|nr:hypothetical protein F4824DRAFT_474516 [Ustulina deusta]